MADDEATQAEREDAETDRVCRSLGWQLVTAASESERAVLRCAISLARGAQPFEIDPVTGSAYTVAAFHRIAPRWAEHYAEYDGRDDGEFWQHRLMLEGRAVQAAYARVHPELAEPVWFPEHGLATCTVCLMNANDAAGLPTETGLDPVTGRIIAPAEGAPRPLPCFKVEAAELKSALAHLVRIGDSTDNITLYAGPDTVELSVATSIGKTPVQATSVVPATVTAPGRVSLTLSVLRAAARKDPAAPLLVDAAATRVEVGGTELELIQPTAQPEDAAGPGPMLVVPIRRLARAVATADKLADPAADKPRIRDLWFALHPTALTVTGTDGYRLAQTSIPASVLPFARSHDPVRVFVPGAAAVTAAKMARSGTVSIGADTKMVTLSAGPHQVRIWHTPGKHPDIEHMSGQPAARFAVRAGDLAELWGRARAEAKRIDGEAVQVYRKSSGRISKPDMCLITLRLSRTAVTCTIEAPELRHYSGKKIKQIDDAHPGSLPGEYQTTGMVEIALTPWALDAVLRDADPDTTVVLGLPADPASRLLLVHTPGEVHLLARAHTRSERFAARTRRMLADLEASRAALAATAPKHKP